MGALNRMRRPRRDQAPAEHKPTLRVVQAADEAEPSLVERYERMAHTFERRPVDTVLRALDLVLAGAALAMLGPLLILVAGAIRITSGPPALYRGARVGRGGRIFVMRKFRTLRPDAESRLGPFLGQELTRLTGEEVTRLGRVLRATHVDEMPQLLNVLAGDMSLVGPRPIRPTFFGELAEEIPAYWQRLVVRPGVTGLAQLRVTREMTWSEKLHHDFEYIADRSVRLYLAVAAATAAHILGRASSTVLRRTLEGH
ncbi:MAG: sugar transferase [Actinobacteria bacterium]|nr:MAG: sugar transferase [Actinomycetota bacterium]